MNLPLVSPKPRSLVSELVFLTAFSSAAIMIAGLLLVLYSLFIVCPPRREDRAKRDLRTIQQALVLHHARIGRYPTTQEGLGALVRSGMLRSLPHDPWGTPYRYTLHEGWPAVWSLGADEAPGGEGPDADVFSSRSLE